MDRSEVAVIIPAHNEEDTIGRVVRAVMPYGLTLVVDDCSIDSTAAEAFKAGAKVITHKTNKGYDGALNSGFQKAEELGCLYAITIDADGQHDPSYVPRILAHLEADCFFATGTRPKAARFSEGCFAFATRVLYGLRDPLCGLKGYRMSAYRELGHFDSYQSIGTELELFIVRRGYSFAQFPITIAPRNGNSRFGRAWSANLRVFKSMLKGFTNRPLRPRSNRRETSSH